MKYITKTIHTLDSVTATTTGAPIDVRSAERISLVVKRSNHSSGASAFSVEVSPNYIEAGDNATWVTYNKLIDNVANTNVQNLTRVASKSLSSNSSAFLTLDLQNGDVFSHIRVTATETTDGTHDAWVILQTA